MTRIASTWRVFLVGFMGAGKTTTGKALAQRLGWEFRDLDDVIEHRNGKTVAQIFASSGEAAFRQMETAAVRTLLQTDVTPGNLIVALGGGTFVQPENRAALERAGAVTVLLEAPLSELRRRCGLDGKQRPLAQQAEKFDQLFEERHATYARARFTVETMGKAADEVAAEIEQLLNAVQKAEVRK
jgi:shikimate kinase